MIPNPIGEDSHQHEADLCSMVKIAPRLDLHQPIFLESSRDEGSLLKE